MVLACFLFASCAPAFAQQQTTTALDRISAAWGQCLGNFQQQIDEIAELRKQLGAANARIKELEAKPNKEKE